MSIKGKHLLHLVQHGINSDVYKPIDKDDKDYKEIYKRFLGTNSYDYVLFYNSRNMNRKRIANILLAYRIFCDSLTKEEASKCILLMHTESVLDAGTDLPAVIEAFCPTVNTKIISDPLLPNHMNALYNIADVTINVSSNEGFGLSIAESIMSGTPVIVNVTGGLQDQIGQTDENGNPLEFNATFGSNNIKKFTKHGCWVKPIWPAALTVQGSPPTPYIFDDLCKVEDIAEAIMYWYLAGNDKRVECGAEGRRWAMNEGNINSKHMSEEFIKAMDFTIENFQPRKQFDIHTSNEFVGHKMPNNNLGFELKKLDKEKIRSTINE